MSGHQASPYAGRSERAGADCRGPGRDFLLLLCSALRCVLFAAGGLLGGPFQSLPRDPSKAEAAKDSPVGALTVQRRCSCSAHLRYGLRCGPAEFRGAAAEGWIRRVKGLSRWWVVIGRRAASPPLNVSWGEQRTRPWPFLLLGQRYSVWPGAWLRRPVPRLANGLSHRETNHSRLS